MRAGADALSLNLKAWGSAGGECEHSEGVGLTVGWECALKVWTPRLGPTAISRRAES